MAKPTLLLYPGAGSDRDHSSLRRDRDSDLGRSADVDRFDFPYRREGRRAPGSGAEAAGLDPRRPRRFRSPPGPDRDGWALDGRADDDDGRRRRRRRGPVARLAGLVLICYPLHPPGKPDQLRVEHLAVDHRAVPVHLGHE